MAVREFTDSEGIVWRVWDVTPERIHPITRREEFLTELQDGWLTFDSGTEKRRLPAPYPVEWTGFSIPQLEDLCRKAPVVPARRKRTPSGEQIAISTQQLDKVAREEGERTFESPRGRVWTVREHESLDPDGRRQVALRFTAGNMALELDEWPADWPSASVERFALMLLDARWPRHYGVDPQPGHGGADTEPNTRSGDAPDGDASQTD